MSIKIASVVVFYNCTEQEINNVYDYINDVEKLYIIDNSDFNNDKNELSKIKTIDKVKYIALGRNKGIAYALNYAANLAIKDGYQWLLTLDQDSRVSAGMIEELQVFISSFQNSDSIGVVTAKVLKKDASYKKNTVDYFFAPWVYTSGNLINLNTYIRLGKFKEEMFIDYVDVEYCYRLRANGYKIIVLNNAILIHDVGHPKALLLGKLKASIHSSKRYYSMARNILYVSELHKKEMPIYLAIVLLIRKIIKIIFWESEKIKKLSYICLGVKHYKQQKLGRCNVTIEMFYNDYQ